MALPSLQECAAALDHLAPALSPVMLNAAVGSVIVLGLAGLAALALRRASAAARHEVWLLGFAAALLLPVLSAALPGWPLLPRQVTSRPAPPSAKSTPTSPVAGATQSPADSTHDKETIMSTTREMPGAGSPRAMAMATTSTPAFQLSPPVSLAPRSEPARAARFWRLPRTAWLLLFWPLGTVLVMSRVLLGHLSLRSLRRRCARLTRGEMIDLLEQLRGELGLRRPVELLSSPLRTMPMTWGMWRARLLVPAQAAAWPPGQRRDVLLHELGHIRRWDCLTQFLSQVASALYWFNPLAWVASRRMQIERERACDDLVLNRGAEAPAYARHLLESVSSVPVFRLAGAAVAMARPSTLEERVRAILDARLNRRGLTARGSLATILLLLLGLVPVAVLKAQQAPADEPLANRSGPAQPARDESPAYPATRPAANVPTGRPGFPRPGTGARAGFGGYGGGGDGGGGGVRFGGTGGGGLGGGGVAAAPTLGQGPTCTLDATLYDVRMPVDQIGRLDVDTLAKASLTADAFEKALAALGGARPMYRASQSVRLSGDMITIGSEMPIVTSSRTSDKGQTINSIQYMSTGANFRLAGKSDGAGDRDVDLDLSIDVSSTSDGGPLISDKVEAPVMRRVTLSHKGPVQPGKPFVVVSVDAGSVDKDGKAVAYIGRITLGEPQPPTPK